jgi:hypothetical protein
MHIPDKVAGCKTIVHLAESAFPILSVPGFWEAFLQRRPDQVERRISANSDSEDLNRLVRRSTWSYTIVPWED